MILHLLLLAAPLLTHSIIRDSPRIELVRIESSIPSPWAAGPRQTRVRTVAVTVAVEQELKGKPDPRSQLSFQVQQTEPGPRTIAVPGPWSGRRVDPGSRLIVFSASDPAHASRVEDAAALPQVAAALQAERDRWRLGDLSAKAPRDALGALFGEYVLSRLDEILYSDATQFDSLLTWLESKAVPAAFRLQVLSQICTRVISDDPAPPAFWSRLAVSGFRVAGMQDAGALGDSMLSTYLPNLLGLNGGVSRKTPQQVFARFAQDRERARAAAGRSALLTQWIGS